MSGSLQLAQSRLQDMNTIQIEKQRIRRIIAERKAEYTREMLASMSRVIVERLLALPDLRKAETVFAYMSLPGEVQLQDFLVRCRSEGKRTAVPKLVKGSREMHFYQIDSADCLREGAMHILEPDPERSIRGIRSRLLPFISSSLKKYLWRKRISRSRSL